MGRKGETRNTKRNRETNKTRKKEMEYTGKEGHEIKPKGTNKALHHLAFFYPAQMIQATFSFLLRGVFRASLGFLFLSLQHNLYSSSLFFVLMHYFDVDAKL